MIHLKRPIHPMYCIYSFIIFTHSLYYNHLFAHFTTTIVACIALSFIHLLYSIVSLIFFYFKICISSSCLN
jgi:hypothetical protein